MYCSLERLVQTECQTSLNQSRERLVETGLYTTTEPKSTGCLWFGPVAWKLGCSCNRLRLCLMRVQKPDQTELLNTMSECLVDSPNVWVTKYGCVMTFCHICDPALVSLCHCVLNFLAVFTVIELYEESSVAGNRCVGAFITMLNYNRKKYQCIGINEQLQCYIGLGIAYITMSTEFQCLFDVFRAQPSLSAGLTLGQVVCFVVYAICLRDDVMLVQPADHPPEHVPDFLPHLVQAFLSEACSIHLDFIPHLWGALCETVWGGTFGNFLKKEPHMSAFSQHGHNHRLSMLFLCEFLYCFIVILPSIFQNSSPYNLPTLTSMPKSEL